ncbi:YcaO-like family protein [Halohasta salina]|uniref:YcaO-like family protein n=1 Tax=Halohasta salina TaxID=2961621 RepID=UPI0020A319E2|nr:YcaO-like family protein [Halohasta salina]
MEIGLVGSGPAAAALRAACEDVDCSIRELEPTAISASDTPAVGAVVAPSGAGVFETATDAFDRWVAVEIGGIGGHPQPSVDATVSLYGPDAGCFRCLRQRVAASDGTAGGEPSGSRSTVRLAGAVAGSELIGLLSGDRAAGRIVELPWQERTFLPVPGCECESTEAGAFELAHRSVGVEDALSRAERAVDDRVGLITEVGERESFPVPYYIAATADTTGFSDVRAAEFAAGVDPDWDRAYMKALGEALERYAAGVYRRGDLDGGSVRTRSRPVPPSRFVRPDDAETPDPEQRIEWVDGVDLRTEERVSLPAEFVQFPPPTRRYRPPITTGLGLGNSTVEATLSGLYEVIERDATMLAWYSTFEPLGLAVDDPAVDELRKRARAESLSVTPLLVTQDVDVPVVAVAVHRDGEWPRFAVGSAADLDPNAAVRSALAEALQNWMELRALGPEAAADESGAIGEYADFPDVAREFVDAADRIPASSLGKPSLTGREELEAVVDRVDDVGLASYAARLTTRDVEGLGFEAIRVVIPAAQPLFTGDPYFGERAESVPQSLGFEPRLDRPFHPYP